MHLRPKSYDFELFASCYQFPFTLPRSLFYILYKCVYVVVGTYMYNVGICMRESVCFSGNSK